MAHAAYPGGVGARAAGVAAAGVQTQELPRPWQERLMRWLFRASVLGVIVSLLVHLVLLLCAAIVYFKVAQVGGAGRGPSEIEMAIVSEAELEELQAAAVSVETPIVPDVEALTPDGPPMEGPSGDDLAGGDAGLGEIAEALRGTGDGLKDDTGLGGGGTGGGAASFFGVEARGDRFAYIVDISGSMRGEKLKTLKVELIESISSMLEHMHFYVVPFSSDAFSLGGKVKWSRASDGDKKWAAERINELEANGGTNPLPAFEIVLKITPRPDAIYFMTDGMFEPMFADEIARLNRAGRRVPIHCLTFGDRSAEGLMREIAKQSGGTYHHIEAAP